MVMHVPRKGRGRAVPAPPDPDGPSQALQVLIFSRISTKLSVVGRYSCVNSNGKTRRDIRRARSDEYGECSSISKSAPRIAAIATTEAADVLRHYFDGTNNFR
ncbi:hypothetical protein EVAR_96647_1 [Eumeta japonica]|uniref:Uncharacterized protein n=1 Tax=Eumeta variegata TaxID=151549 RepID=A0A4C2A2G9_EUMVA|nr:hypothetical protein EVAR_96647_1 [Eumeta japonica]